MVSERSRGELVAPALSQTSGQGSEVLESLEVVEAAPQRDRNLVQMSVRPELREANARVTQNGQDQAAVARDQRRAAAKLAIARAAR